jgi:hypothetical protein
MMILEFAANVAAILTAIAALGAWVYLWRDRCTKQARLERYLLGELRANPNKHTHTTLHLMAELGLTEAEVFRAAFASKHIVRLIRTDKDTGLAAYILFRYSTTPKAD